MQLKNVFRTLSNICDGKKLLPEVFCKKGVLRNFAQFTGKHLCQKPLFNKIAGLGTATLLKKSLAQVFSCEFCEISNNTFFYGTPPVAVSGSRIL